DEVFETIGIRSSVLSYLSPFSAFRHRFPWLVPTLLSGVSCAVLSSLFESTIAESMVLAFFLTLILGLGESVGIQSLTITIRKLHVEWPTWRWFIKAAKKEVITSLLLGLCTGSIIAGIIFFWKGTLITGAAVGLSIVLSLLTATFFGLAVPALLHKTRLDPKVSAGPLVLGLADLFTLFFYFSMAKMIL
ncbi:MAG: magnesium transporter, partial [Fibrobacter sp.]|nr:magnesium transporter [Fibrobacter sp.]